MQYRRNALIEQERECRDDNALEQVERHDREQHERGDAVYRGVDLRAHADDGVERHAEHLGKLRQKIYRVESAAEHGHDQSADGHADERGLLAGLRVVDDAGRKHKRAADDEVCKVADVGGRRALDDELHENLHQLRDDSGHGAEIECADEDGQLADVELIERRGEEQRQLDQH